MSTSTKVIVTNEGALTQKYGAPALARIRAALDKLTAADKSRGISTCVLALDSAADMRTAGVLAPLRSVTDERGTKRAIDTISRKLRPDYLLIVGASDVVTCQTLANPVRDHGADCDADETIASDLPYACEAPYSGDPQDFVEPTRVVGRIHDLEKWKNPSHLVSLITAAATASPRGASEYANHLGLTAAGFVVATERDCGASQHDAHDDPDGLPTAFCSREEDGSTDLVCQYFLQEVLSGASIGRAMLEARQHFVATSQPLDAMDLKTLAQFALHGDPSLQPVARPSRRPKERASNSPPRYEEPRVAARVR